MTGSVIKQLLDFAFKVSVVTYGLFWMIEILDPGRVSTFFNLAPFLIVVVGLGLLTLFFPRDDFSPDQPMKRNNTFLVIVVILAAAFALLQIKKNYLVLLIGASFVIMLVAYLSTIKKENTT
ncbi:MAG: hypothetical protein WC497_01100 [Patescibacteria group bacterium]